MEKSAQKPTYEEAVALLKEQIRHASVPQTDERASKPTYEELVGFLKEQIRRSPDPGKRRELENVLHGVESHEAKARELGAKLSQLKSRYERLANDSLAPALPWIIGLAAVLMIGALLARHYLQ